jgi:hypothetical protein
VSRVHLRHNVAATRGRTLTAIPSGSFLVMTRSTSLLAASLLLGSLVGIFACEVEPGLGSPCATTEDCSGDLICDIHDGQGTCQVDHGHDTEDETACAMEMRDDDYAVGLSKSGMFVTASFVSADPAPPARGDNTWVLRFVDSDGAALEGLDITATPMMPDHGHGTPVVAVVAPTAVAGEYSIAPVNLFMAGYWEITLEVTQGEQQDAVMFGFCVE